MVINKKTFFRKVQKRNLVITFLFLIPVSYFLIFSLPWRMPVKGPIDSQSYVFGFSNSISLIGVALTFFALFCVRIVIPSLAEKDRKFLQELIIPQVKRTKGILLMTIVCISFVLCVVWGWWSFLPFGFFGESAYFLTRLDMMTLGRIPFRDFDFGYGPIMLWFPFLLNKLTGGAIKIDSAYIITVLLFFGLGICAIESITRYFQISNRFRAVILLFGVFGTLNITLGIQYTPIRFIYPLWAALATSQCLHSSKLWKGLIVSFIVPFIGLLLGPEIGLVTCFTSLISILWHLKSGAVNQASRAFTVLLAPIVCLSIFGWDYFKMVLFFGSGAYCFPIFPSPYILTILLLGCWILPRLATAAWTQTDQSAALWMSLLFSMGLFFPAILGRCDPGHVLCNGIGLILFSLAAGVAEKSRTRTKAVVAATLLIFVTFYISFWNHYAANIFNAVAIKKALQAHEAEIARDESIMNAVLKNEPVRNKFKWAKRLPFASDLQELLRYSSIATPRNCGEDIDRFLKASGRYYPEYFVPPFDGTFTPATVEKKIENLKNADVVLVPAGYFQNIQLTDKDAYARGWSEFMTILFVFPVSEPAVNQPFSQDSMIASYISCNYQVIGRFRDYLIMRR